MFDDPMIATIFRQVPADERTRTAAWRQLSDILAQRGNQLSESDVRRSLHALAMLRPQISDRVRLETAQSIAAHCRFAPLAALFAADDPPVAAAMLAHVQLSDADWLAYLPSSTTVSRVLLANRADLSPTVARALTSLGAPAVALPSADLAVAGDGVSPTVAVKTEQETDQIRNLVRRIDTYRARRDEPTKKTESDHFLFETGANGLIQWADGIARGAIIGVSLAEPALGEEPGVDGAAAGAFRRRAEIINARLRLPSVNDVSGEWRMSALPWFDGPTGQFRGYRGHVRRPRRNEVAYGAPVATGGGDSVRQLIHELRSPLNAISGFGQIIAEQMFGPVNQQYRGIATAIVDDAAVLQELIEDIDSSAKGVVPVAADRSELIDLSIMLTSIEAELAPLVIERSINWSMSRVGSDFTARLPKTETRRMYGRLLTAVVDVTENGETVLAQLIEEAGSAVAQLRVVRPRAIRHSSASDLLDPGYNPHGDAPGAAMLSLGFSLRLVDSLARGCGGTLQIGANALTLRLPTGHVIAKDGAQGG